MSDEINCLIADSSYHKRISSTVIIDDEHLLT